MVFDLETTGVDVRKDKIVQFAALKVNEDFVQLGKMDLLVNPGIPIPEEATKVHGIKNSDCLHAPQFKDVAGSIRKFIGDSDLAGHNVISFDVPMLLNELYRCGKTFSLEGRRLFDTLDLFRHFMPHDLETAYRAYTGKALKDAHNALADATACAAVLQVMTNKPLVVGSKPGKSITIGKVGLDEAAKISYGNRATLCGKIVYNEEGQLCLGFSKHKGHTLQWMKMKEPGFLKWMIGDDKDFSNEVKKIIRKVLEEQ